MTRLQPLILPAGQLLTFLEIAGRFACTGPDLSNFNIAQFNDCAAVTHFKA